MQIKVNCKYNDHGAWCRNENVKRSLWGLGARCCIEYPYNKNTCKYIDKYKRPNPPARIVPTKPI